MNSTLIKLEISKRLAMGLVAISLSLTACPDQTPPTPPPSPQPPPSSTATWDSSSWDNATWK
jgi:hypothetical protein